MKSSNRIHQGTMRTVAAVLLAVGLTACAGLTQPSQQDRLAKAQAMFAERCKTAGEKIYRTVDNVEGIYLMKLRPTQNFGGQFDLDDKYGRDVTGDGYIKSFLREVIAFETTSANRVGSPSKPIGYMYVEADDPVDGKRYRYTGSVKDVTHTSSVLTGGDGKTKFVSKEIVLGRTPVDERMSRYGVTYEDISTHEEREHWIAGGVLKVIDLQTSEVIAERVGYMMDPGQGSMAGGRVPWLLATSHACPAFPGAHSVAQIGQTDRFVEKVLKPKSAQGE